MKLIPDWKSAWKFWSIRISAIIVAISLLDPFLPELKTHLPEQWYAILAVAVIVSRVIAQVKDKENDDKS